MIKVLFVNLGSPDDYSVKSVRKYLREFLSDKRVINIPRWKWFFILQIILLFRPKKSARLYKSIWTEKGSPLVSISKLQVKKLNLMLQKEDENDIEVLLAMRYQNPSIKEVLNKIINSNCDKLLIFPVYPQYSATTTASVFDKVAKELQTYSNIPEIRLVKSYYDNPLFVKAIANSITNFWQKYEFPEKIVFSYHGLPQEYIENGDIYYKHCQQTTNLIVKELGLDESKFIMTFQSRFGKKKWIKPYTSNTIKQLAQSGVKVLHIISPAFSVDCLETLEELKVENYEYFKQNQQRNNQIDSNQETIYRYIPALNDSEQHIELFSDIIRRHTNYW